jgi:hypothetical protein
MCDVKHIAETGGVLLGGTLNRAIEGFKSVTPERFFIAAAVLAGLVYVILQTGWIAGATG